MKISKSISVVLSVFMIFAGVCKVDKHMLEVNAADNLIFDYSEIEKNPQNQFYYSDENEFYIDGINVLFENENVTDKTTFNFYTTPKTTYDGKNIDYTIPFIAEYDGKAAEGQLDVKIGMRGDVNCDHKVSLNDLVLIQNDLLQVYNNGKTCLTANDGFGIFLGNADGRQSEEKNGVYGKNLFNIGDAFFVSTYLNGKSKSMYDNILLGNSVKIQSGNIRVSDVKAKAGDIVNIPVSQTTENSLGAFDITCKWDNTDLIPLGVVSANPDLEVFTVVKKDLIKIWGFGKKGTVKNGEILYLKFKIPEDIPSNTDYYISISNVDYFGNGINISDDVLTYDGKLTVSGVGDNPDYTDPSFSDNTKYDYGVRIWDANVDSGTTSAELPVMLLGGLETKSLKMTVQCSAPLKIESPGNAVSVTGNSSDGLTGVYDSENGLQIDFETLKVSIDKNAKAGKYPVNIVLEDIEGIGDDAKVAVFSGSVTVNEKLYILGDANSDGKLNVRDCAFIASKLAQGKAKELPKQSDYNLDDKINVRDAAAIAKKLAG